MENKTYVMGDIHGMYDKLMSCLKQVNFNNLTSIIEEKIIEIINKSKQPYTTGNE